MLVGIYIGEKAITIDDVFSFLGVIDLNKYNAMIASNRIKSRCKSRSNKPGHCHYIIQISSGLF